MGDVRLTDLAYLRDLMARYGIVTKKKYGQNFLVNRAVPERIAACGCTRDCGVLEIGPGVGTLTYELCRRAKKVVALEIDPTLIPVLSETLGEFDNVKVILCDAMKTDLTDLCRGEFSDCEEICVCANLPYYITSPVLMTLLESGAPFSAVTVMVQKEVADRLTARAGTPEYGAITAAVGWYGSAEKLFTVSPGSFLPPPKVESAVVRITIHASSPYADCDRKLFFSLVKAAFGQRRKTLLNALGGLLDGREKECLKELLASRGFPADVRGERLSTEDFAQIARALSDFRKEK